MEIRILMISLASTVPVEQDDVVPPAVPGVTTCNVGFIYLFIILLLS